MVPLDRRSDVFALGVVLFETLCLRRLFGGQSELEILKAIVSDPPPDVREVRGDCPDALAAIVRRALERNREERFQSAGELRAALLALVPSLPAADRASFVRALIAADLDARARSIIDAEAQLDAGAPRSDESAPVELVSEPSVSVSNASGMRPLTGSIPSTSASELVVAPAPRKARSSLTWAVGAVGLLLLGAAGGLVARYGGGSPNARSSGEHQADTRTPPVASPDASPAVVALDPVASPQGIAVSADAAALSVTLTVDASVRRGAVRVGVRRPPVGARRCAEPPCDL